MDRRFISALAFLALLTGCLQEGNSGATSPTPPEVIHLGVAQPVLPAPGSFGTPPETELEWDSVPGATQYRVQVGRDADYEGVLDTLVSGTKVGLSGLEHLRVYSWRVRALGPGAEGDWNPSNFRVFGGYQEFNQFKTGDVWVYSTYFASGPHANITRTYGRVRTELLERTQTADTSRYVFEIQDSTCSDTACSFTSSKRDTVLTQTSSHVIIRRSAAPGYGCSRPPLWEAPTTGIRLAIAYEGPFPRTYVDFFPSGWDPGAFGFIENYGLAGFSYSHISPGGMTANSCQLISFNGNAVSWVVTR